MKRVFLAVLALSVPTFAIQVFRVDPSPVMTTAGNTASGGHPALYAIPLATVRVCTDPACTIPAIAYTDASGATSCPSLSPVTIGNSPICASSTGAQGQFGFWLSRGTYYYTITLTSGTSYGPFPVTVGDGGGGGGGSATSGPIYSSQAFIFSPISPGGALTGGIANSVTIPQPPPGILTSGLTASLIYISGGSGTSESVRLSGGSCVSGGTGPCTLIFQPANSHSGPWSISSGAAGIDLACQYGKTASITGGGSYVAIPAGDYDIYGSIRPAQGCTIDGLGMPSPNGPSGAVNLHERVAGVPLIDIVSYAVTVKNIQLSYGQFPSYVVNGIPATIGSIGIQFGVVVGVDEPVLQNVLSNNFYVNFNFHSGSVYAEKVFSVASVGDGFVIGALGSGYIFNTLSEASGGNGYTMKSGSAAIQWTNMACFDNQGWGIYIEDGTAFQINGVDAEADFLGGISIGTTAVNAIVQNVIIQAEGSNSIIGTNHTAPGLQIRGAGFVSITSSQISSSQGNGLELLAGASGISVGAGTYFYGNGIGGQPGHTYNISTSGSNAKFYDIFSYDGANLINGPNNSVTGSYIFRTSCSPGAAITFGASAVNTVFDSNFITCDGGGGVGIVYTPGSTFAQGKNSVSLTSTVSGSPVSDWTTVYTNPIQQIPTPSVLSVSSNAISVILPAHHITAGLIKTITPPNGLYAMCVDLIADAAFTTDTTGNIATPAITATIGKLYRGCYDPSTLKWYLSN